LVVNQETLEVYGHVVASNPLGEAYVIPLQSTFDQIRDALEAKSLSLPNPRLLVEDLITHYSKAGNALVADEAKRILTSMEELSSDGNCTDVEDQVRNDPPAFLKQEAKVIEELERTEPILPLSKPKDQPTPFAHERDPDADVTADGDPMPGFSSFGHENDVVCDIDIQPPHLKEGTLPILAEQLAFDDKLDSSETFSVLVRKLPMSTAGDTLNLMVVWSKDFIHGEVLFPEKPQDRGFCSAILRFKSLKGALEAQKMLDGKPTVANDVQMIAEIMDSASTASQQYTFDSTPNAGPSSSSSSTAPSRGPASHEALGTPQIPIPMFSRMAGLSLNTDTTTSPASLSYFSTPKSLASLPQANPMPPTITDEPLVNSQLGSQHYGRHNSPPVNPADQNPPCNTLYVGNLPIDASEDELKALFWKQPGYKRLLFRTKQNGPMCFVEFDDVSFATQALHELYRQPLHKSIKGGIRLSFSKTPLGVLSGQEMAHPGPHSIPGVMQGMNNGPPWATTAGPPSGLTPSHFCDADVVSITPGSPQYCRSNTTRMDAPHQTYTDKCVQLFRKVLLALADSTDAVNLESDWDFPTENSERWANLLAKLVDEVHQRGHILENHESEGTDTVFSVLTSGMAETVELLETLKHQTSQSLGQLKARVALHAESVALILAHLDR
jgi:hypothetical protein